MGTRCEQNGTRRYYKVKHKHVLLPAARDDMSSPLILSRPIEQADIFTTAMLDSVHCVKFIDENVVSGGRYRLLNFSEDWLPLCRHIYC